MSVSLVLEGGGMRGTYSTGVIDFLHDEQIQFDSCYGVSAGSGHACSFLSKQRGRAFRVVINNINNPEYAGLKVFLKTGNFFNTDFLYNVIPNKLDLFDYKTFSEKSTKFFAVATNIETGEAEYLEVDDLKKDVGKVIASSSLPFLSKIQLGKYLDGGVADSIPVRKALETSDKVVVVLTREEGYQKSPFTAKGLLKIFYRKYPRFCESMLSRADRYNETLKFIREQERVGKVFVFRPQKKLEVGRLERNAEKLRELYDLGFEDSQKRRDEFLAWLAK